MHTMELIGEHEGTEEWHCPVCGRRMMITWQPWKKVVVEPGDNNVAHTGGKGGLRLGSVQIMQGNQQINGSSEAGPSTDDHYLAPWQRWLDGIDSDDLWNKEI